MTTTSTLPATPTFAPPSAQDVVIVRHLNKTFRDFWLRARVRAVEDLSFEIHRGEVFGLLGPNGSGKSTTIKILLGLLHASSGHISVFGKPPTEVAIKKRIGYLPEESYLYPFLNARETLDYYAKLFGLDQATRTRRTDELLAMVGPEAVQFRPVHEYSKGMQRRIGIAQALINDPEFLILDEPTTGLDPIGTRQIKDLILDLARRGKTILLSSHLLADVEDCVDRMVILYGGKIQAQGTCDQLLESRDRSIIETDQLDDETISRIDALIRERTGGASAITRVSRPRQRLEELFIDIVERARANRLANAGAQHGGTTAAFLKGEQPEGEAVIAALLNTDEPTKPAEQAPAQPAGPDENLLGALLDTPRPASPAPASRPRAAQPTQPAPDVDLSVIGELLGDKEGAKRENKPGGGNGPKRPNGDRA